jgi:hypothetical protein
VFRVSSRLPPGRGLSVIVTTAFFLDRIEIFHKLLDGKIYIYECVVLHSMYFYIKFSSAYLRGTSQVQISSCIICLSL